MAKYEQGLQRWKDNLTFFEKGPDSPDKAHQIATAREQVAAMTEMLANARAKAQRASDKVAAGSGKADGLPGASVSA